MKILCFTPLHPDYGIKPASLASIMALVHDDVLDRHFSANDNPFDTTFENVTYQHNKAREMALQGGYDALLSVEADMIAPPDTIGRLIEANADIAYGLYVWRHKLKRWSAYKSLNLWGGESISLDHTGKDAREAWGQIVDVAGLGMGCTLVSRDALKEVPFRLYDGLPSWIAEEYADDFQQLGRDPYQEHKQMLCNDYLLALDAQHYGFTQRTNMNVICGHIDGDRVLWPDLNNEKLFRTEPV